VGGKVYRFIKRKPRLLYAPVLYRRDKGIWPPSAPETWYYKWQRKLYYYLSARDDIVVIWKGPPRTSNLFDPISLEKAKNIRYSMRRLGDELLNTDMVFLDFPSTPLWDAVKRGIPSLCVTPWCMEGRHDIQNSLGSEILWVERERFEETALVLLDQFILLYRHPAALYTPSLHKNRDNWLQKVLENP
jgi:hypothetical protein